MSPSNISRSKSIKQRVSDYLSKRIYGEVGISEDSHRHQGNPTELRFSDSSEVLRAAASQPPPAKIGFRQRFIIEYNIAREARLNTLKRSATTGPHKPRPRPDIYRSTSTSNRPRNHQPSSSTRQSSSITRGRRHRGEDSSTVPRPSAGSRQNHREHPPHPRSSSVARSHSPKPLLRAQSYRPTSFTTKPAISTPLAFVPLNDGPAAHDNANIPETILTDRTDPWDGAEFDIHPTQRMQRRASEPLSTTQMPINCCPRPKGRVEGNSRPLAPHGTTRAKSIISTGTRWGDFISDHQSGPASKPGASNQAAKAAPPRQPPPFQGPSKSPAKFPSFSPAAHHARGPSPDTRSPVAADPIPPSSSGRRSQRPVICKLCKGLSDPTISYPDVKHPVCSRCAPIAFATSKPEQPPGGGAAGSREGSKRERRMLPTSSAPLPPRPPTPPVKDFAAFDFTHWSASHSSTPESTGSQPKFDAYSTDEHHHHHPSHRPRPPSSEYSHATGHAAFNPYVSSMGNPFTSRLPDAERADRAALPRLRTQLPRPPAPAPSTVGSYVTMSPNNHTHPFIPHLPPISPLSPSPSPSPLNRRSSFYRFYDDVFDKSKGKGRA